MMSTLKVYSQNVSGDKNSELLIEIPGMEDYTFENRIKKLCNAIPSKVDLIAFNEVRYQERVDLIKEILKDNFHFKEFANNTNDMSFRNILCLRKVSQWEKEKWEHKWVAENDKGFYLSEKTAKMEGDPHGRCVGIVYLVHRHDKSKKVCVAVSHVVAFGEVKRRQQMALFSLNETNSEQGIPTVIVGDVNRFPEEDEQFIKDLREKNLLEVAPERLVIPYKDGNKLRDEVITSKKDIGTFTPWPNDHIYEMKKNTPLQESRLDAHLYTEDANLIKVLDAEVRAVMFRADCVQTSKKEKNFNDIRFRLDRKMASDHMAIITTYKIK